MCFEVGAVAETPDPLGLVPLHSLDVMTRCCWVPPSPSPVLAFVSSALLGENVVRALQKSTKNEEARRGSCADLTKGQGLRAGGLARAVGAGKAGRPQLF